MRSVDFPRIDGPQAAEDPEERRLAAAVGARDEQVHPGEHRQRQRRHHDVAVGRHHGHVYQADAAVRGLAYYSCTHNIYN